MKKTYIVPNVELNETLVCQMMALSLVLDEEANDGECLSAEEAEWDMW